jgi:hypothetical protein
MPIVVAPRLMLVLLAVLLSGSSAVAQPGCQPVPASESIRLDVSSRADQALVLDARVELASAAPIYVEYGNDQLGWLRTPTTEAGSIHHVPIIRLRAETEYQLRAFSLGAAGCPTAVAVGGVTTGGLPQQLRTATAESSGQPTFPLVMMDWPSPGPTLPPGAPGDRSKFLVTLDQTSQVVWYYQVPPAFPIPPPEGAAYPIIRLSNGNLMYIAAYYGLEEITLDGRVVRRFRSERPAAARAHHDVIELPDGRLLYLGAEDRRVDDARNGGPPDLLLRGDTLHLLDLSTAHMLGPRYGDEEEVWNAFDSLDPTDRVADWENWKIQGVQDWTHANSMVPGPGGSIVISNRHSDQIISLGPDYKTIQWKLGGPGSSFTFADPSDRFRGQHSVQVLPNGHILVFDNGNYRVEGEFSRALELELDFATMTARKVWEYRHDPDILSDRISNVVRLPNGNTLVNFGWRVGPDEPVLLVEIQPDGAVIWEQTMRWRGLRSVRQRAYPLESLAGEQATQPTALQ